MYKRIAFSDEKIPLGNQKTSSYYRGEYQMYDSHSKGHSTTPTEKRYDPS